MGNCLSAMSTPSCLVHVVANSSKHCKVLMRSPSWLLQHCLMRLLGHPPSGRLRHVVGTGSSCVISYSMCVYIWPSPVRNSSTKPWNIAKMERVRLCWWPIFVSLTRRRYVWLRNKTWQHWPPCINTARHIFFVYDTSLKGDFLGLKNLPRQSTQIPIGITFWVLFQTKLLQSITVILHDILAYQFRAWGLSVP